MILQIYHPQPGHRFYIDQMGHMPAMRCEAHLLDENNQTIKVPMQWALQISENIWPGQCPSAKIGRQIMSLQGSSIGVGVWAPPFNVVCGGDASLSVSAEYQSERYQAGVNFTIIGRNPSPETVVDYLGGEQALLTKLARFLSELKQFDVQGKPYSGEHGEVGIMQLCEPAAQWSQRWSWVHNVEVAKSRLQSLHGIAKAYLDQHRDQGCYPNNQSLSDDGVMLREVMQRFLGGSYWQWDERNYLWRGNPPDDTVDALLR